MSYKTEIVKNSGKGGNRPIGDYRQDLSQALQEFERSCSVRIDGNVMAILGASGFPPSSKKERSYTHPHPFLVSYGDYLFGCISVPADLDDGKSDYSNLFLLATDSYLVAVFNDPHWVYNSFFGGAVLSLLERNKLRGQMTVGETLIKIFGFTVSALDHTLEALENRFFRYSERVPQKVSTARAFRDSLDGQIQSIQDLSVEVGSLSNVVSETASIVRNLSLHVEGSDSDRLFNQVFSTRDRQAAQGLQIKAFQLVGNQRHLSFEVSSLLSRCDRLQESELSSATHRVAVLGGLILIPNLLFDYFGQAFDALPGWIRSYGHPLTLCATVVYWAVSVAWFKRRGYL